MSESVRVVVVGPGGVGKSAITLSFVRKEFLVEYDPTIEDSYSKSVEVDGKTVELDITDTAGQEEFRGLWGDKHLQAGDGFLLVCSCVDASTLSDLEPIQTQIIRIKENSKVPMVVCLNKVDLEDLREVSEEQGREFAEKAGALYLETSAKTFHNIDEAFIQLIREILKSRTSCGTAAEGKKVVSTAASSAENKQASVSPESSGAEKPSRTKNPSKKKKCIIL